MNTTKRILIFDNNLDNGLTIKVLLKKNGYEVSNSINQQDCIKKLKKSKPDLFLIDAMMPREKILKTAIKIKGLKIIYLITDESEKEHLKLYKNVVGFINEPRDINSFLNKIKEFLK